MSRSTTQGGGQVQLTDLELFLDGSSRFSYPGQGSTWFDLSGRGNNFTLNNSPTKDSTGFTFNGTNQWASCVNTTCGNFGTGSFTIEYGINYSSVPNSSVCTISKRFNIVSLGTNGSSGQGWIHRIGSNQHVVQDNLSNGVVNTTGVQNFLASLTGVNQHMTQTLTRVGANTMIGRLYRNAVLVSTSTYIWTNFNGNGSVDNASNILLMLGPGTGAYLPGKVFFVRLYRRDLTASEIQQNFESSKSVLGI
jgi:hypothetical protein